MALSRRWGTRRLVAGIAAIAPVLLAPVAADANQPRFAPNQLLVRFDPEAPSPERAAALERVDSQGVEALPLVSGLRLVRIPGTVSVREAVDSLDRQAGVLYAEPDFVERLDAAPNDPEFGLQWALDNTGQFFTGGAGTPDADINAVEAWDLSTGSGSVAIAIVDTGVAWNHADLAANIWSNPDEVPGNGVDDDANGFVDDIRGWDFNGNDNDPMPSGAAGSEHGTEVAGAAGAVGNNGLGISGASQQVSLMPLRVGGATSGSLISGVISAYGYAVAEGIAIVNRSGGSPDFSQAQHDAIAAAPNTLFVFAAGNDGTNNDVDPRYPCADDLPNVVCVAATDRNDELAQFGTFGGSNFGPGTVDLGAPGSLMRTTTTPVSAFAYTSGTSLASPITAGAAAVLWSRFPAADVAEIKHRLLASVDPLVTLNGLVATGGRLNLFKALTLPPETTITMAPKKKTRKRRVTFGFESNSAASSFQCKVDKKKFKPCESPARTKKLDRDEKHTFRVSAIDQGGNVDPTPARMKFKVK